MALLFTFLCGAAVLILGYFSYYFHRGHFIHGTESILDTEIRHAALWNSAENIERALSKDDRVYLLFSPQEQKLAGNIEKLPETVSLLAEGTIIFHLKERRYAAKIHTFPDGRKLLLGVDITAVSSDYRFMQWLSVISIFLMLLVIFTSYLISRFVVSNTNRIALTAKKIMDTGDFSRRIEIGSRWDDLSYMATVLNEFLDRIEHLMAGIRLVADNIAHDLRTPLTRLRGKMETMKKQDVIINDKKTRQACESLIEDTDHILETFNALLRISRIETGKQHSHFSHENLKMLVHDALDLYEPLAEEKNISLSADLEDCRYDCDRDLLFQAFANLLDNAVKFTPPGGAIKISLLREGGRCVFAVCDNGPGVQETDKEKIFDRFYRAEESRHTPGSGLGLSLVTAVVELHGGKIKVESAEPGLKISLIF